MATNPTLSTMFDHFRKATLAHKKHNREVYQPLKRLGEAGKVDNAEVVACARRDDEIGGIAANALLEIEMYPVTSLSEMMVKLDFVLRHIREEDLDPGVLLADVRRCAREN